MTDLKQEIVRIENESYKVRFAEIINIAIQRNELLNLLSGSDEYIYNSKGELWLNPQNCGGPTNSLLDIERLVVTINDAYEDIGKDHVSQVMSSIITQMLNGTPIQFYYAIRIYCQLAIMEANRSSKFAGYYLNKYSFVDTFYHDVTRTIQLRKAEFERTRINYTGYENLYEWCKSRNNLLNHYGLRSIVEE